jgi:hypothetical protein
LRRAGRFVHLNCRIITFLTPIRTTQFRARVAALDDVATAVLVRSFTELALPLVLSRSSRERVISSPFYDLAEKHGNFDKAQQLLAEP